MFHGFVYRCLDTFGNNSIACVRYVVEDIIHAIEVEFEGEVCVELVVESLERSIFVFGRQIEGIKNRDVSRSLCHLLYFSFD